MWKKRAFILTLAIIFFTGQALSEDQIGSSFKGLKLIAHYKEETNERIFASGDVEIHYGSLKLFADYIELNQKSKDVYAEGNVVFQTPETTVSAEWIRFNLETSQGEMQNVSGKVPTGIFFEAESLERKNKDDYDFRKAKLTTCTQPVPRWNFSFSKGKFKRDKYVEMWNSVLSIKKIPLFYLPYFRYPLQKERSTGFLTPLVGHSNQKGFSIGQSFFWAIKSNMDATFTLDYYPQGGLGRGLEFRYLFSKGTTGEINLYYFTFKKGQDITLQKEQSQNLEVGQAKKGPAPAYLIRLKHRQSLPFNFSLVADVDLQSSFDFLREFDNNFMRAVVSNRSSQVYLSRSWSYYNLNIRASRFETYFTEIDNSTIRNNLPEVEFSSSAIKIFSPLYFSFRSSFSRWEEGWESEYKLGEQRRSQGLGLATVLTLPFSKIPWLTTDFSFTNNFNYYFMTFSPESKEIVDEPLFVHNYMSQIRFVGPVFFKIYHDAKGTAKLKHIIEPSFEYRNESPTAFFDRIITPSIFTRNHYMRYGLTNRFLTKKNNIPMEIFALGLTQTFYLEPEESPQQIYLFEGEIPQFSDVECYMRFYPVNNYSFDFTASYNPYYKTFSNLMLGANLGSPWDSVFFRVNWFKGINPWVEQGVWNRHQINFLGSLKIPRLSLDVVAEFDYNILLKQMLYSGLKLVYHYQCLDFQVDLKIFYFREKPDVQFKISFGLGNIGMTTDFLGGTGFLKS